MHIRMCVATGIGTSAQHLSLLVKGMSITATMNRHLERREEPPLQENDKRKRGVGECMEKLETWYTTGGGAK